MCFVIASQLLQSPAKNIYPNFWLRKHDLGAAEMAQQWEALVSLAEYLVSPQYPHGS